MKNEEMRKYVEVPSDVTSDGSGKNALIMVTKMKILIITLMLVVYCSLNLFSTEITKGYIRIKGSVITNLKVSTQLHKVDDMKRIGSGFDFMTDPPSNDSVFLKQIKGIEVENSTISYIDDSFFELRANDSLERIHIHDTDFNYDNLIKKLIKYHIRLAELSLDLKYLKSFPKNIDKILGIKMISIDFGNKNITIPKYILNMKSLNYIMFSNNCKNLNYNGLKNFNNLKELYLNNCKNIMLSIDFVNKVKLNKLHILNGDIIEESYKNIENCEQLESLTIENCKLLDNQIEFGNLKNLHFLNLRNNNFVKFPENILYLKKLTNFLFSKNKIKSLPIGIILKLAKKEPSIYLEISDTFLNNDDRKLLKSKKGLLDSNGYEFECFDYYSGTSQNY